MLMIIGIFLCLIIIIVIIIHILLLFIYFLIISFSVFYTPVVSEFPMSYIQQLQHNIPTIPYSLKSVYCIMKLLTHEIVIC